MSYDDVIDNFMAWNPEVYLNNVIHDICASLQFFLTGRSKIGINSQSRMMLQCTFHLALFLCCLHFILLKANPTRTTNKKTKQKTKTNKQKKTGRLGNEVTYLHHADFVHYSGKNEYISRTYCGKWQQNVT